MGETGLQPWHADGVPNAEVFAERRQIWRAEMASDTELRQQAIALQMRADVHRHTYQWEWLGVPVIRIPEDMVILQELFWEYRPTAVVETGVARGGSLVLDATLQTLVGQSPSVLGIDIKIYDHTLQDIDRHPNSAGIQLLETDSTSTQAAEAVREFLRTHDRAVLILDSHHTHSHVLQELQMLTAGLPVGSFILVADTLIEEFPPGYYKDRPWDRGNSPMSAVGTFLAENADFVLDTDWSRRGLITEFRDGVLRRIR